MVHIIGQVRPKRKLIYLSLFLLSLGGISPSAVAGDDTGIPVVVASGPAEKELVPPDQAIEQFLTALQKRDHLGVLSRLSEDVLDRFGGSGPRLVMNTLRLKYHSLYDHDRAHILPAAGVVYPVSNGDLSATQIRRVQLFDRDGGVTLAILRLIQAADKTWRIDGITVIDRDGQRGV